MANRIVQAVYDLKDFISGKLVKINEALRGNRTESDKTTEAVDRNNKRLSDSFRKSADTIKSLRSGFQSFRDGVNEAGSALLKITGIAGLVSSALGAISIGRLFGGAVESAKDFEATLSEVRAVSGATTEQLGRMRQAAESASETTKFSAQEAAAALGELARASGDADVAIAQLPATLNLAQAAGLDASRAAEILTTSVTQFGLAASDSARVADLFTREANSTNDSVESLGLSMSYVAPLARQLGLNIEQTTALLGAMAEQGFRGERAGTALRNVFSQLLDPSSNFRAELVKLNITSGDFESIIQQLAAAGDKGKAALLSLDAAARPAIAALVQSGGAGIRRLTEDFKNAGGEAERTAKTMGENFAGASSRLRNAFDALRRSLVDPILEPLAKQFDSVAARIRAFTETADFARLRDSIRDFVVGATESLVNFIGSVDFSAVAERVAGFTKQAGEFFRDLSKYTEDAGRIIGIAGSAISAAYNTIQTAILTAAGVVTGSLTAITKAALFAIEGLSRLNGTAAALQPVFDNIRQKIGALEAITEAFAQSAQTNAGEAGAAFGELGNRIAGVEPAAKKSESALKALGVQGELTKEKALELSQQFLLLPANIQKIVEPGLRAAGVFEKVAEAAPKASDALKETAEAAEQAAGKIDLSTESISKPIPAPDSTQAQQSFEAVAEASRNAAEQAAADAQSMGESQRQVSSGFAVLANVYAGWSEQFGKSSKAASERFEELTQSIFEFGVARSTLIEADTTGLAKFAYAIQQASEQTQREIDAQREKAEQLAEAYASMSDEQILAQAAIRGGAEAAAGSLRFLAQEAAEGRNQFELLGREDLAGLSAALDAAAAKVEQITQQAVAAKEALSGIADSIQDEIDRIRGDDKAIEDRRFEEQLARIEEQFELAGDLGSSEYREAKRRAEELHRLRLKQIEEERRAREEAEKPSTEPKPKPTPDDDGGGGGPRGGGGGGPRGGVSITINGDVVGADGDSLAEKLARLVKPQLDRIDRNSR